MDNAVAFMEARVIKEMDVGDHTIFAGEVVNADVVSDKACMTYDYYHQIKGGKTPKAAATYIEEKKAAEKAKEVTPKIAKYRCTVCGYIYEPDKGDPDGSIKPGTAFEDIPDDWVCPECGASKDEFEIYEG